MKALVLGIEYQTSNARVSRLYVTLVNKVCRLLSKVLTHTELCFQNSTGLVLLQRMHLRRKNLDMRICKGGSEDQRRVTRDRTSENREIVAMKLHGRKLVATGKPALKRESWINSLIMPPPEILQNRSGERCIVETRGFTKDA